MMPKYILLVISCMALIFGNFTIISEAAISDGAHGDNPRFFFLPPMVPDPNPSGEFDPSLSPVVQICEWTGSCPHCNYPIVIAEFTTTGGPGSETVRVVPKDEHYIVNWHTGQFNLDEKKTYRIRVLVKGIELGHADVVLVESGKEAKDVDRSEFIPLYKGLTLPIKFWIGREEVGWTLHTNSADPVIASVPTDGGEILQFLADKDGDGRPLRLVGVRRFDPSDPDVADVLTFGENRLPERVLLRDGSLVMYEYPSETHVVMTIVLPDGNSAKMGFDLNVPSSSSVGSTNAAEPGPDVDKSFALEGSSMPMSEYI